MYEYDTWGKLLSRKNGAGQDIPSILGGHIGNVNPILYRGYYYDTETGLYYVSSRYYDPEIGRWINADDLNYLGADGTPISYNLFAYCGNNPVMRYDVGGYFWDIVFDVVSLVSSVVDVIRNPSLHPLLIWQHADPRLSVCGGGHGTAGGQSPTPLFMTPNCE